MAALRRVFYCWLPSRRRRRSSVPMMRWHYRFTSLSDSVVLRMPADVALVGFDEVREATQVDPPLTTVANRSDEVGVHVVQLLLERMAMGRDQPGRIVERPLPLISPESTLGRP